MSVSKVHDPVQKKPTTKTAAFNYPNSIVVTVNPALDKLTSTENINAKTREVREMFANYRNKK